MVTMTHESGWRGSVVNVKKVIIRDAVKTTQGLVLLKICGVQYHINSRVYGVTPTIWSKLTFQGDTQ